MAASGQPESSATRKAPTISPTLTYSVPIEFKGRSLELRGFIRTEDVTNYVGLWMREDGQSTGLAFDNMQSRQVRGTTAWTEYSIALPLHLQAAQLTFGFLLAGTGRAWVDDLRLLVDDAPIWAAPRVEQPKTPLDLDHEFDRGSGVSITGLTTVQIENLATLGKVWGFLKYHHPAVTAGTRQWDFDLLRILPSILAARIERPAMKCCCSG